MFVYALTNGGYMLRARVRTCVRTCERVCVRAYEKDTAFAIAIESDEEEWID